MRKFTKIITIFLITVGILFALSPIITTNISFITGSSNKSSEYSDDINSDNKNLQILAVSGKIHIINNSGWEDFRNVGNCTGSGTESDPYVIKDLEIDSGGSGSGILIENSDVYFKIENCTVHKLGAFPNAGIQLYNVTNGKLVTNNCSSNYYGIYLYYGNNNTISGNAANYSTLGIYLYYGNNNTISGNTASYNTIDGIALRWSNNYTISGNTASYNTIGIHIDRSDYNTISGNTFSYNNKGIYLIQSNNNTVSGNLLLGNDECIFEEVSQGNVFENNDCREHEDGGEEAIPGYELVILISLIGTICTISAILIRKRFKI